MRDAQRVLAEQFHEMRWRILSLAADFDRIERAAGGSKTLADDANVRALRECIHELLSDTPGRAERVQMKLSDLTPPPEK